MKNLIQRTITGISLVVLFIGSILLSPSTLAGMILMVYLLGTMELFRMLELKWGFPAILLALSGALTIITVFAVLHIHMQAYWILVPIVVWIVGTVWSGSFKAGKLAQLWLAIPLASFIAMGWLNSQYEYRSMLPALAIALIWIHDTLAYVIGSLLGKHPMTPVLSPGKTWEGTIGGVVLTTLIGWILYGITGTHTPVIWMATALLVCLSGLAGDLFESGLKRKHSLKDTGTMLPGHGGILDRFDSLLFAAPAMWILHTLISLVQ